MRRSPFIPYIALAALAASFLVLFRCAPEQPKVCAEQTIILNAWAKALEIEKMKPGSALPPKSIRIVYEPRYYPYGPFGLFTRICGTTEWYYPALPDVVGIPPSPDVQLYVAPGDCEMLFDVMVHEFLHVIHAAKNGGIPLNDEHPVRAQWPKECR
jgi:hypothetical protein